MDKNLDIKEQEKQEIIDQIFSLINQIDNMSKIISKNSTKIELNSSSKSEKSEEEWVKWSWTEFEIIWNNKEFKATIGETAKIKTE